MSAPACHAGRALTPPCAQPGSTAWRSHPIRWSPVRDVIASGVRPRGECCGGRSARPPAGWPPRGHSPAWQSLAGLTSTPNGASFREVEARVGECIWHVFNADTQWFYRMAWDIGVAGVAPDHRRLAVLAATDTD
ncbi:DUF6183 family protein [Amycolatopsis coloradensis]|uniref:DUF6183 family protein n=1 Tax=Amycolatopsis coloradensis TaxID=76021 RepID=UPI003CC90EE5